MEGIPLGSLGPSPVISRDDGGPVLAAAAPPVAGGNPFSLDMSSQAARPPVRLRSVCSTSTDAERQRRDDGDGLLGKRAETVPADTGDLGRTAQRVSGAREVCQR